MFLGISRTRLIPIVRRLRELGAGAVVCFSAGFSELGSEGRKVQDELIEAAGDMPLLGPNCYGIINCVQSVAVWPYFHGCRSTEHGVALVSQSGMLATTLTMNRRSVDFSYVISVGNQAMLGVEDFVEELLDDTSVSGFALYVEEIRDKEAFVRAATRARDIGKPITVIKAGSSATAASTARNHTGSNAGSIKEHERLFRDLGVVLVDSPNQMLETLKMVTCPVLPRGLRMAAFTCSGGDAAILGDIACAHGIEFPQPSPAVAERLRDLMPDIAAVHNPLDCTTQLWGKPEINEIFATLLSDDYDVALFVQDYPRPDIEFETETDFAEAKSFAMAAQDRGIPAVVCSSISENLNEKVREFLRSINAIPLQGLAEAAKAINHAYRFYACRGSG